MSDLTLTDLAAAPAVDTALVGPAPARSRWGFWATTAWGVAVFATMLLVDLAATIAVLVSWGVDENSMPTAAVIATSAAAVARANGSIA